MSSAVGRSGALYFRCGSTLWLPDTKGPLGFVAIFEHATMKQQRRGFIEILKSGGPPSSQIASRRERLICERRAAHG